MKVVITGGTGFIGLNIGRALVRRGTLTGPSGAQEPIDSIVLFDAVTPPERPSGLDDRVSIVAGDISDRDTVFGLVDRDDTSVFHLASIVSGHGEQDFDLALKVNLDGGRHVLEALRARAGSPRLVFASSIAVFGGAAMPDVVGDDTKQTARTTYGVTKTIMELLINDYTRKGFLDGRSARLPTIIIRPGKPNAAASSFCSGVFREPLGGQECILPVTRDTQMPLLGYRNTVAGFIGLHELAADALGDDRAVNLRSRPYTVVEMVAALERVAEANRIPLGPVIDRPDPQIQAIVRTWAAKADDSRAQALGLPIDESLDRVVQDYIDDFLKPAA
ncbi:MAG: NAD-dependent epimerase/dehydratase family protein [Rhodospirillaceae bacterium]|nr:NAD-dependent epimerase/dehydratase family protein [Rhodospirillaceae bacterium]